MTTLFCRLLLSMLLILLAPPVLACPRRPPPATASGKGGETSPAPGRSVRTGASMGLTAGGGMRESRRGAGTMETRLLQTGEVANLAATAGLFSFSIAGKCLALLSGGCGDDGGDLVAPLLNAAAMAVSATLTWLSEGGGGLAVSGGLLLLLDAAERSRSCCCSLCSWWWFSAILVSTCCLANFLSINSCDSSSFTCGGMRPLET